MTAVIELTDQEVVTRVPLLENIENGNIRVESISEQMRTALFPDGYNPRAHGEDNLNMLRAEAVRRGLQLT